MKRTVALLLAAMLLCTGALAFAEGTEKEPVTIAFGGWGQYFLHTEWIESFMEKYPWFNVEIVHPVTGSLWNAEITQLASIGQMPDLFSCESLSYGVQNNWFYDLTDMFYADEESAAYPENLLPFGMKDSHIYMLASDMYPYYIEVNLSLLDEMNLPYPEADWSTIGAIAYAWQDDRECYACGSPDCPCETAWGLVRTDGSEKPVTDVFRKYAKML